MCQPIALSISLATGNSFPRRRQGTLRRLRRERTLITTRYALHGVAVTVNYIPAGLAYVRGRVNFIRRPKRKCNNPTARNNNHDESLSENQDPESPSEPKCSHGWAD